jgi:N-acyl amino acid synthase of PEP-CTERM/exosortase system
MQFQRIDTPELLEEVFRLRYQVYCRERHFINADDHLKGCEQDEFDAYAVHFGAFEAGELVGAVRLIAPTCERFPVEIRCPDLKWGAYRRYDCAEISRLTISKEYRRRLVGPGDGDAAFLIRKVSPMTLGLCQIMYAECRELGIDRCLALMECPLALLLRMHGFFFERLGPEIDYFGPVAPYGIDVKSMDPQNIFLRHDQRFLHA